LVITAVIVAAAAACDERVTEEDYAEQRTVRASSEGASFAPGASVWPDAAPI
jgi:hypothetical protein